MNNTSFSSIREVVRSIFSIFAVVLIATLYTANIVNHQQTNLKMSTQSPTAVQVKLSPTKKPVFESEQKEIMINKLTQDEINTVSENKKSDHSQSENNIQSEKKIFSPSTTLSPTTTIPLSSKENNKYQNIDLTPTPTSIIYKNLLLDSAASTTSSSVSTAIKDDLECPLSSKCDEWKK